MSPWGWKPERDFGVWRYGAGWMRPLAVVSPYLTVAVLLLMFYFVGGTFTRAKGILFDLPETDVDKGVSTDLVLLVMPKDTSAMVFFEDSRYFLSDVVSTGSLREHLAARLERSSTKTLLVMADRNVSGGVLMQLAELARRSGVRKVLFAEKNTAVAE